MSNTVGSLGFIPNMVEYVASTPYTKRDINLSSLSFNTAQSLVPPPYRLSRVNWGLIVCGRLWSVMTKPPLNIMSRNEAIYRTLEFSTKRLPKPPIKVWHDSKRLYNSLAAMLLHEAQHAYMLELFRSAGYETQSWSLEDVI